MQISGISSGFMGFALAACVSAVCIESRGQICDHDEHHVLTGNLVSESFLNGQHLRQRSTYRFAFAGANSGAGR